MTHPMDSTASRQPGRDLLFGLVFSLVATLFTLAVGELVIRVVSSRKLLYNIEMVKYAKALKMRDPKGEVSHVHRPSSRAKLMGVDVSLNSLGDRGPELTPVRDSLRKRVLVLGSSITMGWGVPFPQTFTATAERTLNERRPFGPRYSFEFVNGGIGNYNTVFQHVLFRRQFPVVKPDMVVLHYFISDVQPRTMGRDSFILKHSYLAAFLFDKWSQIKLRFGGQYVDLFTFYDRLYADSSSAWSLTRQHVQSMHDEAARAGVPFVIVITPDIHDLSPGTPYKALYDKLETTFKGMGISTVNSFDALQKDFGRDVATLWIQPDDPHPNAKGHAVMADVLVRHLTEQDPLRLRGTARPAQ